MIPKERFLSCEECTALAKQVASFAVGGGDTNVRIESEWSGNLRWARNQTSTSGDIRNNDVTVIRSIRGARGWCRVNQINDARLDAAVRRAERMVSLSLENIESVFWTYFPETHLTPDIWSDTTYGLSAEKRAEAMRLLSTPSVEAQMVSAGYIQVSANGRAVMDTEGRALYYPYTRAQYSVTVRDPKGTGSGWAGVDWHDWNKIDAEKLSQIALDKCLNSRNPVAVEPGRWTVVLEPQAVCDIVSPLFGIPLDRPWTESGNGPFAKSAGLSKIGDRIGDDRITISADPMDPDLGFVPFDPFGEAYAPAVWIENGVLKNLAYNRRYAVEKLGSNVGLPNSTAFRMSGGPTSIEEMIAQTRRGLLVTRFSDVTVIDWRSMMSTGFTRDGLWLIENGKISKAVKNFRFTESPLFMFNNILSLGTPVRCFRPIAPAVCPPLKAGDFSMTTLVDAV